MFRWLIWFLFGFVLFVTPYAATEGIGAKTNPIALIAAIGFFFWLWVTPMAVAIRIVWWLVWGRRRSSAMG